MAQTPSMEKETMATGVLHPGPNDVLLGRGASVIMYEGNVKFRDVVKSHKARYNQTRKREEKERIAKEIIDVIASRNGRFLQRISISSPTTHPSMLARQRDCWRIASQTAVMEKVKQALRDRRPSSSQNRIEKVPRSDRKRKMPESPDDLQHLRSERDRNRSQGGQVLDFPQNDVHSRSRMDLSHLDQICSNSRQQGSEMRPSFETVSGGPPGMQYVTLDEMYARNRLAMALRGEPDSRSAPSFGLPIPQFPLSRQSDPLLQHLRSHLQEQEWLISRLRNQQIGQQQPRSLSGEEVIQRPASPHRAAMPLPTLHPYHEELHRDQPGAHDQQSTRDLVAMLHDQDHRIAMQLERLVRLRQDAEERARRSRHDGAHR